MPAVDRTAMGSQGLCCSNAVMLQSCLSLRAHYLWYGACFDTGFWALALWRMQSLWLAGAWHCSCSRQDCQAHLAV